MAELPDLQVYASILSRKFGDKKLKEVDVKVSKKLNVSVAELKKKIESRKLNSVTRYGKTLHFNFSDDVVLQVHLMLRGELFLLDKKTEKPKHEILSFNFRGGEGLAVVDFLKQARPTLQPEKAISPDALEMDLAYFEQTLSKSKKMVKEVMMDQKKIRGIGNSYADEILWDAKISPLSISNAIPHQVVKNLYQSIGKVLKQAIKDIAAENGDELHGELRDFMKVHGAKLDKSPTGAVIKSKKIGGRTSYFTDEQELYN